MRARFRIQHRRLQVSLVHSRRVDGLVREDHIAALGSIPVPMTIAGRLAFWDQAEQRLAKVDNRMDKATRAKVLEELAAKIPMVTEAEREAGDGKDELAEGVAILLKAGWSTADIVRAIRLAKLNDDEVAEIAAETVRGIGRAERAAFNKVYRRRRAVTSPA